MQNRLIALFAAAAACGVGTLAIGQDEAAPSPSEEGAPAAEEAGKKEPPMDPIAQAREWVTQLADDSFKVREAAQSALWAMGEDAFDLVEEGLQSDDPEISYRARVLLQRIRAGITPETPQKVVELVQKYFKASARTKKDVLEELLAAEAYPQILRLYRFETDETARRDCDEVLSKAVMPAVLRELADGRPGGAEEILRLAPGTDKNSQSLASLLRVSGTLEEELAKTAKDLQFNADGSLVQRARQMDAAALHLALLRAAGKASEARALAEKMGRTDLVASLALFEGDAAPYFNWFMETQGRSPIRRLHGEIALKRWQGDEKGAAKLAREIADVARGGGVSQREALLSLMLNGYLRDALPIVERNHSEYTFGYYETVERPLKALEMLGYGGDDQEREEWLETRLAALRKNWDGADTERSAVMNLASFFQTRGEEEEAHRIVTAVSKLAEAEGKRDWLEFLGRLNDLGGGAHELGFVVGAAHLGADDEGGDAAQVIAHLFGEGDSPPRLWENLGKSDPELDASERLLLLGGLYGATHVEAKTLDGALERLFAMTKEGTDEERVQLLTDLLEAANSENRDDAGYSVQLLEELAAIEGVERWTKRLATYYGYVSDWKKTAAVVETILEKEPRNLRYLAFYGGIQRRLGNPDLAEKSLQQVEQFCLDESGRLQVLALDLERSGAMEPAAHYWRLLLLTNPPSASDWYWQSATSKMAKHAREAKQWRVAAAFAEVDALQYLGSRSTYMNPVIFVRKRFTADLYRALALREEGDHESADRLFRSCFELMNGDGMLADDYFPLLREAGAIEEHDRNFQIVHERLLESIEAFPKAHNTYNSAAWMASRAARKLDHAQEMISTALAMRPRQAAYLDTAAEVWFAKHDRKRAVEWSRKAVMESYHAGHDNSGGVELRDQYDRFRFGKLPPK